MFPYAARTGTRRTLDALRAAGWGLMVSAKGMHRTEGFARWSYDNGAWSAHTMREPFDEGAFLRGYEAVGCGADFAVLPDIVAGGARSLEFSLQWRGRLGAPLCPLLLAVQDGMSASDVETLVGADLGIFVGGSTAWKEATLARWGVLARRRGAHLHVGRVTTARRVALCALAGVDSIDGSAVSRWGPKELKLIDNAVRQWVLPCF